jgi:hypothetical protein
MTEGLRIKVHLSPGARQDIERLNQRALKNPHSRDEALLEAAIVMLHRLNGRRHPTKPLDYDSRFADLSDCIQPTSVRTPMRSRRCASSRATSGPSRPAASPHPARDRRHRRTPRQ